MKDDLIPLRDILMEIEFLHSIRDRSDFEAFKASPTDVRAASYAIMVISEAARRIPSAWIDEHPNIPWHAIRAIGNKLRHELSAHQRRYPLGRYRDTLRAIEDGCRGNARQARRPATLNPRLRSNISPSIVVGTRDLRA